VKELVKCFIAFASVITGVLLIVFLFQGEAYYVNDWTCGILGVALLAGGVTYFWTRSKFYKK
jgi:uncharacterized membrane protein